MGEPLISIIVPIKNAEKTIEQCLTSILNIDYTNYQVIVVDDGSIDRTPLLLTKYNSRLKIITQPSSAGPSKARNLATRLATGEYVAFTDADCIVDRFWLKELLAGFSDSNVVSVGGSQEVPEGETKFGQRVSIAMEKIGFMSDYMRKERIKIIKVKHNPSCNVIYRRSVLLEEGGFLEGLWPGEDVELDYRLRKKGYTLIFNPKAIVYHFRPQSIRSFSNMMYRYGYSQGFLVRRYGVFRKIQLVPFSTIILSPILLVVFFKFPSMALVFLFIALFLFFNFNILLLGLGLTAFLFWNAGFWRGLILMQPIA